MRLFLEVLLGAGVIAFGLVYVPILVKRVRERRALPQPEVVPDVDARAAALAREDERVAEAVDLRGKIAELARKKKVGLGLDVVREVDELVLAMVALYDTKSALRRHLASVSDERLARDAQYLDAASVAQQKAQVESLRARANALEAELVRAVAGLRETWLGLLDALAQPGGMVAPERVRGQIETLRVRIQAEREARAVEVETA